MNRKAHTIAEVLMAGAIVIILFASSLSSFVIFKNISGKNMAEYNLQRSANITVNRFIRGIRETSGTFGLRSAASYTITSATDISFIGADGATRRFFLSGNSIIYSSLTQSPNQKTIYTAPAGAVLTLLYWNPYAGQAGADNETLGIYLSISQQVRDKTVTGSVFTYVNLRNMPK